MVSPLTAALMNESQASFSAPIWPEPESVPRSSRLVLGLSAVADPIRLICPRIWPLPEMAWPAPMVPVMPAAVVIWASLVSPAVRITTVPVPPRVVSTSKRRIALKI